MANQSVDICKTMYIFCGGGGVIVLCGYRYKKCKHQAWVSIIYFIMYAFTKIMTFNILMTIITAWMQKYWVSITELKMEQHSLFLKLTFWTHYIVGQFDLQELTACSVSVSLLGGVLVQKSHVVSGKRRRRNLDRRAEQIRSVRHGDSGRRKRNFGKRNLNPNQFVHLPLRPFTAFVLA